jgi:hypothetical protein
MHFSSAPRVIHSTHFILLIDHPKSIRWRVNIMKLLTVQLYPASHYLLSLIKSKHYLQHPILKHYQYRVFCVVCPLLCV